MHSVSFGALFLLSALSTVKAVPRDEEAAHLPCWIFLFELLACLKTHWEVCKGGVRVISLSLSLTVWFEYQSVGCICGLCGCLQGLKRDLKRACICFWQECQWKKLSTQGKEMQWSMCMCGSSLREALKVCCDQGCRDMKSGDSGKSLITSWGWAK